MAWVYDVDLSRLEDIYWTRTLQDIQSKLTLRVGYEQAKIIQDYQTFSLLLAHAFGGKKNQGSEPKTFEEAEARFKALFGKG